MDKPLHIIYIPGLGDDQVGSQLTAVKTWQWWKVEAELYQMHWADNEPWDDKFKRLINRIDELSRSKTIALVGASAGATAVINAYAARKDIIIGCVLIAGKVNHPEAIGPRYRHRNPSFITSAYSCERSLATLNQRDRQSILSRYGMFDEIVPLSSSKIPGAHNKIMPSFSHVITIATQITLGAPSFMHFLKQQAKSQSV